ncbi:MAG TPA: porin family protein [Bacteroidia bacterium]|jgi:hypothetical protein|nr:porin family protein [Bacteroidia bacterium]
MKKIILLIATLTSMLSHSNAQENDKDNKTDFRNRLLFGLKAGANYSNVYDSQGESFQASPKFGLAAGAFLAIPIGKYLGIQPEVLFSQKGFQATGRILGGSYDLTRTTDYIDVPLLFAFKPSEFFTLLAGPQYSYLLKQTDVFTNGTTSAAQETEFENNNVRKNTLCLAAGIDITMKHIVIGARAAWDIQNNNGDGTSTTPRYKNAWYQVTLGYRFFKK